MYNIISVEEWGAILETLYLLSLPGMLESICHAKAEPIEISSRQLDW